MAYDIPRFNRSYESAGDLSGSFFRFVKLSGSGVVAVAAATDPVVGVLQNKPAFAGDRATVMTSGVTKVLSSKAIAAGVAVYVTADGRVTDTAASNHAVGLAETSVSAADQVLSVLLKPLGALA